MTIEKKKQSKAYDIVQDENNKMNSKKQFTSVTFLAEAQEAQEAFLPVAQTTAEEPQGNQEVARILAYPREQSPGEGTGLPEGRVVLAS